MIWNRFRLWFSRWNLLVFCLLVFWLDPKCATKITKIASGMPFCICVFLCVLLQVLVLIVGMKPSKTDFTACVYPQVKHGEWKPDANPRNRHIHLQRKIVTVGLADSTKYVWKHRSYSPNDVQHWCKQDGTYFQSGLCASSQLPQLLRNGRAYWFKAICGFVWNIWKFHLIQQTAITSGRFISYIAKRAHTSQPTCRSHSAFKLNKHLSHCIHCRIFWGSLHETKLCPFVSTYKKHSLPAKICIHRQ